MSPAALTPAEKLSKVKKPHTSGSTKDRRNIAFECKLYDLRTSLGLSLRDVARAIGRSDAAIFDVENGADVRLTTVMLLAEFFGKSIDEIWTRKETP